MTCKKCGSVIGADDAFCTVCGEKITVDAADQIPQQTGFVQTPPVQNNTVYNGTNGPIYQQPKKKANLTPLFIAIIAVLILIIGGLVTFFLLKDKLPGINKQEETTIAETTAAEAEETAEEAETEADETTTEAGNQAYAIGNYEVSPDKGLNIRADAGSDSASIDTVDKHDVLTVTQVKGTWGYVPTLGGWVQLSYCNKTTKSENVDQDSYEIYRFYKSNAAVNVRSNAGTQYTVIKTIGSGSVFYINSVKHNWGYSPSVDGWIKLINCSPVNASSAYIIENNSYSTGNYRVTPSVGLYVRSGAGKGYSQVGSLKQGDVVYISSINGTWGYSTTLGGWICLSYCSKTTSAETVHSPSSSGSGYASDCYYIATDALNVRTGASTNYSILLTLDKGDYFYVSSVSGVWGYVPALGGWVCLNYCRLY